MNHSNTPGHTQRKESGFSLVELLFVIGIIAVLISILIPVISKARLAAQTAGVQNQIQSLAAQIQAYQSIFQAYPGPLSDDQVYCLQAQGYPVPTGRDIAPNALSVRSNTPSSPFELTGFNNRYISGTENLVLGLLGGLRLDGTSALYTIVYDPAIVGQGAMSLNPNKLQKYNTFGDTKNLSWREENGKRTGSYKDGGGDALDTLIPEFVDQFNNPMPILYLRAKKGVEGVIRPYPPGSAMSQQYDLKDIIGYTGPDQNQHYIGEGKRFRVQDVQLGTAYGSAIIPHGLRTVNGPYNGPTPQNNPNTSSLDKVPPSGRKFYYPYDGYAYFEDPSNRYQTTPTARPGLARAKDTFILISAGADRVYGTPDDICSFGPVVP